MHIVLAAFFTHVLDRIDFRTMSRLLDWRMLARTCSSFDRCQPA